MKFDKVKTAVIGCGMISETYFPNLINKFSIIDVVGCADMVESKAKAASEKYGIRLMTNEEILSDPEIELVVNLTYPLSHFEVNKAVLSAGKNLYCEKMMALDTKQADELLALADKNRVRFACAPDTFLGASMQTCRKIVDAGLIGQPVNAEISLARNYQLVKNDNDDAGRLFSVVRKGGGIPYDMGGYYLHTLFNIFGSVKRVGGFAVTRNATRPYLNPNHAKFDDGFFIDTPNLICSSLEFASGVYCSMSISSDCGAYDNRFEIHGTEGTLYLGDPNSFGDPVYIKRGDGEMCKMPFMAPYKENSRGIGCADMAWAIRTGRPHRLSEKLGYHALEIINAMEDCAKDNTMKEFTTGFERPKVISGDFVGGQCEERCLYLY